MRRRNVLISLGKWEIPIFPLDIYIVLPYTEYNDIEDNMMNKKNRESMVRLYDNMSEKYNLDELFNVAMDSANADIVRLTALDILFEDTICNEVDDYMELGILFSRIKDRAFFDGSKRVKRAAHMFQIDMQEMYNDRVYGDALPLSAFYGVSYND